MFNSDVDIRINKEDTFNEVRFNVMVVCHNGHRQMSIFMLTVPRIWKEVSGHENTNNNRNSYKSCNFFCA